MARLRLGAPLFALGLYVVADLVAAQACKQFLPWWEPSYFERTYRVPSPYYHHDLLPGIGVPYEATCAEILGRTAVERSIEVLNAGVSSYSPLIYHRKARHLLEQVGLDLDAIVVFLDISAPYDEVHRYRLAADGRIQSVEARRSSKESGEVEVG
jgi:hypothetical protein